jgi:hypothetical protein
MSSQIDISVAENRSLWTANFSTELQTRLVTEISDNQCAELGRLQLRRRKLGEFHTSQRINADFKSLVNLRRRLDHLDWSSVLIDEFRETDSVLV